MPAWIVITVSHLEDYLVAAQVAACREAALGDGQTDPFTQSMRDVASRIRNQIQGCKTNQISATAYAVPPEFKSLACLLILQAMQSRLPGMNISEDQKEMIRMGMEELKAARECKIPVTLPDDPLVPADVQQGGEIVVVSSTPRRSTRTSLAGL